LRLKSDYEKELAELRRKYDVKLQESEVEFQQTKKTLETNMNTVRVSKILANVFKSKYLDLKVSGASGMQHGMFVFHRHPSFNIAFTDLTWIDYKSQISFQFLSNLISCWFNYFSLPVFFFCRLVKFEPKPELADTSKVLRRVLAFRLYLSFLKPIFKLNYYICAVFEKLIIYRLFQ